MLNWGPTYLTLIITQVAFFPPSKVTFKVTWNESVKMWILSKEKSWEEKNL